MLWAMTSFFNPVKYQRRLENFRVFRKLLEALLVTVELAFGDFQLTSDDACIIFANSDWVVGANELLKKNSVRHLFEASRDCPYDFDGKRHQLVESLPSQ